MHSSLCAHQLKRVIPNVIHKHCMESLLHLQTNLLVNFLLQNQAYQGPILQLSILKCCTWPGTCCLRERRLCNQNRGTLSRQRSSSCCTKAEGEVNLNATCTCFPSLRDSVSTEPWYFTTGKQSFQLSKQQVLSMASLNPL